MAATQNEEAISILDIGIEKPEDFIIEGGTAPSGINALYHRMNERMQSLTTIKLKDKVAFFQLLSIMLGAGVSLVKALYVLSEQTQNVRMKKIIATMAQKVETGKTLSSAMDDYHGIFTDAQVGMVRAGEVSGQLNEILKQISVQTEKSAALASKVKGAMVYPTVVFTIMAGAVFVILTAVVPKIMELFTSTGAELPTSTKLLLATSNFTKNNSITIVAVVFVIIGSVYVWKRTAGGKYYWDAFLLRLPVFGKLLRNLAISRFTRTLGSLMDAGIPIVKALQIDADAVGNEVYRKRIFLAAEDVSRGIPLAENLLDSKFLFPEMVVSMIAVGEQTAELSKVSDKIAKFYDEQVDEMASNMSKLLEPLIMVVMGVVVGSLIVAVMQPIFGLLDVAGTL